MSRLGVSREFVSFWGTPSSRSPLFNMCLRVPSPMHRLSRPPLPLPPSCTCRLEVRASSPLGSSLPKILFRSDFVFPFFAWAHYEQFTRAIPSEQDSLPIAFVYRYPVLPINTLLGCFSLLDVVMAHRDRTPRASSIRAFAICDVCDNSRWQSLAWIPISRFAECNLRVVSRLEGIRVEDAWLSLPVVVPRANNYAHVDWSVHIGQARTVPPQISLPRRNRASEHWSVKAKLTPSPASDSFSCWRSSDDLARVEKVVFEGL
ncbi:uncharacterized protein BT62DRAFT_1070907 [Guyanagaster necrorhizus]|uniref:Uncharacterized protein n=1 Tax=Guyanagaster necrorhizus TaxID=856835 RepID=A0A9P8AZG8_9AGAR|nr:uncharacterized protein BT62DRAFT_1070907 [Guyanagaster necrorhizus MCA 3950]KAG7453261.1 hypothetical protein BT62DRAFT_1070907 [Guyanagaster necrorhizus MCA 3950]